MGAVFDKCIDVFAACDKESLIFEHFKLEKGTYLIVDIQPFGFEIVDTIDVTKDGIPVSQTANYDLLCHLDYYSRIIDKSKALDVMSRKIISNNYLSFAVKKKQLSDSFVWSKSLEKYYNNILRPKLGCRNDSSIFDVLKQTCSDIDETLLHRIKDWISSQKFCEHIDMNNEGVAKVFFIYKDDIPRTKELYKQECLRYLLPRMYPVNKTQEKVKLPYMCLTYNANKDTFYNTKGRPVKITADNTITRKQFFDFLLFAAKAGNRFVSFDYNKNAVFTGDDGEETASKVTTGCVLMLSCVKTNEGIYLHVINDANVSTNGVLLKSPIDIMPIIDISGTSGNLYTRKHTMSELEQAIKEYAPSLMCKSNTWFDIFCMGKLNGADSFLRQLFATVLGTTRIVDMRSARHRMNLLLCLSDYLALSNHVAHHVISAQKEYIEHNRLKGNKPFACDAEYYYAIGQLLYYLMYQYDNQQILQPVVTSVLDAKSSDRKERIIKLYVSHVKGTCVVDTVVQNIYNNILKYSVTTSSPIDKELIVAGFVDKNLLI